MSVIFNEPGGGGSGGALDQNPRYQNGVAHFVQESPAAWRDEENLVPLQVGDLWYKPTDNGVPATTGLWRYTGAYWVSEVSYWQAVQSTTTISAATINAAIQGSGIIFQPSPLYPYFKTTGTDLIWFESWSSNWFATNDDTGSVVNSNNSFGVTVGLVVYTTSSPLTVNSLSQIYVGNQKQLTLSQTVQKVVNMTTFANLLRPTVWASKINGTPSVTMPFWISAALDLRKVHP